MERRSSRIREFQSLCVFSMLRCLVLTLWFFRFSNCLRFPSISGLIKTLISRNSPRSAQGGGQFACSSFSLLIAESLIARSPGHILAGRGRRSTSASRKTAERRTDFLGDKKLWGATRLGFYTVSSPFPSSRHHFPTVYDFV